MNYSYAFLVSPSGDVYTNFDGYATYSYGCIISPGTGSSNEAWNVTSSGYVAGGLYHVGYSYGIQND